MKTPTTVFIEDDAMSVETPKGNNKSGTCIEIAFTTFLYLRLKVAASKKGSKMYLTCYFPLR